MPRFEVWHIDDVEEEFEPLAPVPDDDPPEELDDPPDELDEDPLEGADESLVEAEDCAALEDEPSDVLHAVAPAPSAATASTAAVQRTALFTLAVMISLLQHRILTPAPTVSSASYGR
jgi:hypothetical protein